MCSEHTHPVIAAFDFDGTLICGDSFFLFARHVVGRWRLWMVLLRSFPELVCLKMGWKSNSEAKEKIFGRLYRGRTWTSLQEKARTFSPKVNKPIYDKMCSHVAEGDEVVIVTASLDVWMRQWAERNGVKLCCTETEIDSNGCITGKFSTPNCYGEEKPRRLLQLYPCRDEYYLIAYGDSAGDEAMFTIADEVIDLRN